MTRKLPPVLFAGICLLALIPADPARADICDNARFFEQCPSADPAFAAIIRDFRIRRDGKLVELSALACTAPVSALPDAAWSDELAVLQALRAIYYMDRGRRGHLPWTPGSLYDWLRANLGGINISTSATFDAWGGQRFASTGDSANYLVLRSRSSAERAAQKTWAGQAALISLIAHERRHGDAIAHVRCCPAQDANDPNGACDRGYEEGARMPPYAIQYWLAKQWINGGIEVGIGCLPPAEKAAAIRSMRQLANGFASPPSNFCGNPPPPLTDANDPPAQCKACGQSGPAR